MSICHLCKKQFKTERSRDQHALAKHGATMTGPLVLTKEGARAVMDDMDDLPDGAFFAMAEELGLLPGDFDRELPLDTERG